MNIEISIIVPIYNLEKYIHKCVSSILSQSFTNFELILVNDGSTDQSGKICDEYAEKDNRVKVIHKENGGIASSRNAGLEVAVGKYIGFVDNDDYINKFMYEILYKHAMEHSSDIVVCDYINIDEGQKVDTELLEQNYNTQHFSNLGALHFIYEDMEKDTFIYPWNKLYKRSLFSNIKYELGNIYDDESVAHELLYKCNSVTYIQNGLYYYVKRKGSQINTAFTIKKFGRVYALKAREVFFRKNKERELHDKALKHYMQVFFWYYFMATSTLTGIKKELKALKRTFDKSLIYLLAHKDISWKQKLMCVVFSVNPDIFRVIKDIGEKNKKTQVEI
ncbi:glycosyltransferase [Bacillus sp. JJ1566]|uniref:glycosyltransferase family 2 protein n=1 Tax=Bacillus sp. JJ1566 TaxID=3122961 RepID=UPI003000D251